MSRTVEQIRFAPRMPKTLRVAAYARVSSGKDAMLHSLAAQVDHYSTYIRRHPPEDAVRLECRQCGKPIVQVKGRKAKYFCSDKCRNAWWNAHPEKVQRKAYYHLTCEYCGKEFISYGNRKRKYCSRPCYADARRSHSVSDTLRNAG